MSQAGSGRHWLLAAAGVDAPGDAGGAVSAFERELPDEYLREGVQKQLAEAREAASVGGVDERSYRGKVSAAVARRREPGWPPDGAGRSPPRREGIRQPLRNRAADISSPL